jgi:NitT/TauT family transport system substrate-binding protein
MFMPASDSKFSRAAVLGAAAASFAATALPYRAGSQEPTRIRVGASLDDGIRPLLYGIQAGLYKRVGLEIEMVPSGSGAALATAVAGGAAEFAKSSTMALITAYTHGVFFKMVSGATLYQDSAPGTLLVVMKDSPIKSLDDVPGKTIAVNALRSLEVIGVRALIDQHGGNSGASKYIELPDSAMLGALQQGRVDMAAISDPALADALKTGQLRTFASPFRGIAKELLIACWFCSDTYAKNNRDIVNRFASATRTATLYTNAHHAETIPLLAAYSHLSEDTIGRMTRVQGATSLNASAIQPAIDAAVKYNLIPKAFDASELLLS